MKKVAVLLIATLVLATLTPAMAQPFADVPTNHWAYDAIAELAAKGLVEGFPDGTFKGKQSMTRYEMAMVIARIIARIEAIPTPPPLPADLVRAPALNATNANVAAANNRLNALTTTVNGINTRVTANANNIATLQRLVNEFRAELQALGVRVTALEEELNAVKGRLDNTRIAGTFYYGYASAPTPPSTVNAANNAQNVNNTALTFANGRTDQARVRLLITGTVDSNTTVFTRLRFRYNSGNAPTGNNSFVLTVERLYLHHNNLLGFSGLNIRLGRDTAILGPGSPAASVNAVSLGLLLDSNFSNDNRDGLQVWLPSLGPIRIWGAVMWNRADSNENVYAYLARASMTLMPGVVLGLNYRGDTAGIPSAAGACPSATCLTGTGWGADLSWAVLDGFDFWAAWATYTRTGDSSQNYWVALARFDLAKLMGFEMGSPILQVWYRNFDPYAIAGGVGGTFARGGFWSPDYYAVLSVIENMTSWGARFDLTLWEGLTGFATGEFGTFKGGGPNFTIWSAGLQYFIARNTQATLAYSSFNVDGGVFGHALGSGSGGIQYSNQANWSLVLTSSW
jgi:hypothetical protein